MELAWETNGRLCVVRPYGVSGLISGLVYPKISDEKIYPLCVFTTITNITENDMACAWARKQLNQIANREQL